MDAPTAQTTFEDLLTPDTLSALMRSTWTWDDRALRRDLDVLLANLDAARLAAAGGEDVHADTLRARAHSSAGRFVAAAPRPEADRRHRKPH